MSFILSLLFACSSESTIQTADASFISTSTGISATNTQQSTDIENIEAVVTTKANLNMAIVEADGKYHTWMEGRSGILRTEPKISFWLEQGPLASYYAFVYVRRDEEGCGNGEGTGI